MSTKNTLPTGTNTFLKPAIFVILVVLFASISRVIPHIWNFTPVAAMALFGGAKLKNTKWALLLPLLCMFFSDCLLQFLYVVGYRQYPGFHDYMLAVYASLALVAYIGMRLQNNLTTPKVILGSLLGSILFFIITNFAVWYISMPHTQANFVQCYVQAIPFFKNNLMGDLLYNGLFFGSYFLIQKTYWSKQKNVA